MRATGYQPDLAPEVERALLRWPNVPAAFGWLRLDRRARWWLPDGPISHAGTVEFLHRHYGADDLGRWFVQNGPQRAYVTLDLAPWVFSLDGLGGLVNPAGVVAQVRNCLVVTPDGELLVETNLGLGNIVDRDLEAFTSGLASHEPGGDPLTALAGRSAGTVLFRGNPLTVLRLAPDALPVHFGFQRQPQAPA